MANKYENFFRWLPMKLKVQEKFERNHQSGTLFPRGAIYTCYLGENVGHEKSRLEARPCLIVSSDSINSTSSNVIIVPLSKQIKYADPSRKILKYKWHYVLKKSKYSALSYDSAVQCEDIRAVSKSRFGKFIVIIDKYDMDNIRKRLRATLQI